MKIIVCGGRDFTDHVFLFETLDALHKERPITLVIEGGQRTRTASQGHQIVGGADYWGMRWAKRCNIPFVTVRAEWKIHGNAAGPIRNQQMLNDHKPDVVVAFPGGDGTADMVHKAKKYNTEVIEVNKKAPPKGQGFFS